VYSESVSLFSIIELRNDDTKLATECAVPAFGAGASRRACSTQPYVCVDKEGQSHTRLNVLHADAVPWNSPSDDQLAYFVFKAIF